MDSVTKLVNYNLRYMECLPQLIGWSRGEETVVMKLGTSGDLGRNSFFKKKKQMIIKIKIL